MFGAHYKRVGDKPPEPMDPPPKDKRLGVIHEFPYEKNPTFVDYYRLEPKRILQLGLEPRFARTWDVRRNIPLPVKEPTFQTLCSRLPAVPMEWVNFYDARNKVIIGNSLAPFASMQKRVCGWGYDDEGDYRRKRSALEPVDVQRFRPKPEFFIYRNTHFPKNYHN